MSCQSLPNATSDRKRQDSHDQVGRIAFRVVPVKERPRLTEMRTSNSCKSTHSDSLEVFIRLYLVSKGWLEF